MMPTPPPPVTEPAEPPDDLSTEAGPHSSDGTPLSSVVPAVVSAEVDGEPQACDPGTPNGPRGSLATACNPERPPPTFALPNYTDHPNATPLRRAIDLLLVKESLARATVEADDHLQRALMSRAEAVNALALKAAMREVAETDALMKAAAGRSTKTKSTKNTSGTEGSKNISDEIRDLWIASRRSAIEDAARRRRLQLAQQDQSRKPQIDYLAELPRISPRAKSVSVSSEPQMVKNVDRKSRLKNFEHLMRPPDMAPLKAPHRLPPLFEKKKRDKKM